MTQTDLATRAKALAPKEWEENKTMHYKEWAIIDLLRSDQIFALEQEIKMLKEKINFLTSKVK